MFNAAVLKYIKIISVYLFISGIILFSNNYLIKPLVGVLNSICVFATLLFIYYNVSEAPRLIKNLKSFILGYNLGLLGYRLLLLVILQVSPDEWSRIYNIKAPSVAGFTGKNLLITLMIIAIYMVPIGYLTSLFKSLFFHPKSESFREEQEKVLRTGDQGLREKMQ